jgi:hypothetical protein
MARGAGEVLLSTEQLVDRQYTRPLAEGHINASLFIVQFFEMT